LLCESGKRHPLYVEEPALIVEVLSPHTESSDRGLKFEYYRSIPSLTSYLLLSQDRVRAELFQRGDAERWEFSERGEQTGNIVLDGRGMTLRLSDLYRQVEMGNAVQPSLVRSPDTS
jgi:Uma2 family endonuclease